MSAEGGVTQTLLAGREDGVPGNCIQAAVATLLDKPLEAVPHVLLFQQWNHVLAEWAAEQGYTMRVRFTDTIPAERCIVAGTSPRGVKHVCVAEAGRIVWDPHPSRDGLSSVDEVWFFKSSAGVSVTAWQPRRGERPVNRATEMWTRPNTSSGEFRDLRRRGISFKGAGEPSWLDRLFWWCARRWEARRDR